MTRPSKSIITCFFLICFSTSTFSSPSHARNDEQDEEKSQSLSATSVPGNVRHSRSAESFSSNRYQEPLIDQVNLIENLPHRLKRSISSVPIRERRSMMEKNVLLNGDGEPDGPEATDFNNVRALRTKRRENGDHGVAYHRKKRENSDHDVKLPAEEKTGRMSWNGDDGDGNTNLRIKRSFDENLDAETEDLAMNEIISKDTKDDENVRMKRSYVSETINRNDFENLALKKIKEQHENQNAENNAGRLKRSFDDEGIVYLSSEDNKNTDRSSNSKVTTRIKRSVHNGGTHAKLSSHLTNAYMYVRLKRSADYDSHVLSGHVLTEENISNDKKKRSAKGARDQKKNILPEKIVRSGTLKRLKGSLASHRVTRDVESTNENSIAQQEVRARRDTSTLDADRAFHASEDGAADELARRPRQRRAASGGAAGEGLPVTREDSAKSLNEPTAVHSGRVKRNVVAASRILRQQQMQEQKQMAGDATQQVSSYTAYELSPAATKHKGSKGTSHKNSGHKAGFVASSGHKSGSGHKAGKGFEQTHHGAHQKKGASGHSGSGGKKYSGGEHKSHHHAHGTSGKKGSKGHARGHKAHHSKAAHADGFKAQKNKKESGGKKSFYDESDHKGYHSKYDHFDSFHESSTGGSEEKNSHSSLKKHDVHGEKGHHEHGKQKKHKADHSAKHGHKDVQKHDKSNEKTASHEEKHASKH